MATYRTESVHTFVVTADNGAEYRIPLPHDHWSPVIGPYVRQDVDGNPIITFAVYDIHPEVFEWPEYIKVHPLGQHQSWYSLSDICLARYRTHAEDPIAEAKANGTAQLHWFIVFDYAAGEFRIAELDEVADGAVWDSMIVFEDDGGNPDTRSQLEDILDDFNAHHRGEVYIIVEMRKLNGEWHIQESGCIGWEVTKIEAGGGHIAVHAA